ncbi:DUF169 domain-containing protein [bacterium]|nr:DUF169 domain-containing protein [bacterium]
MSDLKTYQNYGEELERRLKLKTFPIAVKLLNKEDNVPDYAKRPLKDLGHHLSLCQGYQLSRREGETLAMLKEDNWCFEPVVGYGLGEPPEYFMEGYNRYPRDVKTLEAGRHYAQEFPRLETGKYKGVLFGPLKKTNFKPDVVMIYCDPEQLSLLLLGREFKEGTNLKCSLSSHTACVYAVIPAIQYNRCQIAIPCRGDHYAAMAADYEMIFTVPESRLNDLMAGLRYVEKTDSKLPKGYRIYPEYPLPEAYDKIAKMMGYI